MDLTKSVYAVYSYISYLWFSTNKIMLFIKLYFKAYFRRGYDYEHNNYKFRGIISINIKV